jgi:hypothetical protein
MEFRMLGDLLLILPIVFSIHQEEGLQQQRREDFEPHQTKILSKRKNLHKNITYLRIFFKTIKGDNFQICHLPLDINQ